MEQPSRSRGLAVEFAVLGYLIEAPMHGYDLRDRLAKDLGSVWRIASSQMYQVLRRMEEEGWIVRVADTRSAGPSRHVYRATDVGTDAFWNWATTPVRHVRRIRVEFLAKVHFLRRLELGSVRELVERQLAVLRELHAHLGARTGVQTEDSVLATLAVSYRRNQVEGTIRWLKENERELCERKGNG